MSTTIDTALTLALTVSAAIWLGGYVAVVIVAATSAKALDAEARVRFFRRFGGDYLKVALPALLIAYATGWALLGRLPWSAGHTRLAVACGLLLAVLLLGIAQARDLTRLRQRLASAPEETSLATQIWSKSRAAALLRGLIGLITLFMAVDVAGMLARST